MKNKKFYVKVGNVYFGRRWFIDRYGNECEGKLCLMASMLMAKTYTTIEQIEADMNTLGVNVDQIKIEGVS